MGWLRCTEPKTIVRDIESYNEYTKQVTLGQESCLPYCGDFEFDPPAKKSNAKHAASLWANIEKILVENGLMGARK
jgi:hypothetical protein